MQKGEQSAWYLVGRTLRHADSFNFDGISPRGNIYFDNVVIHNNPQRGEMHIYQHVPLVL